MHVALKILSRDLLVAFKFYIKILKLKNINCKELPYLKVFTALFSSTSSKIFLALREYLQKSSNGLVRVCSIDKSTNHRKVTSAEMKTFTCRLQNIGVVGTNNHTLRERVGTNSFPLSLLRTNIYQ